MVGAQTMISGTSANRPPSEFVEECNQFLRDLGCQFVGDIPGLILEKMAEEARCLTPSNQSFVHRVSTEGCHFHYPGPSLKRPLELLWRLLGFPTYKLVVDFEWLVSKQEAVVCMRAFHVSANLPITDARELALNVLELIAERRWK